MITDKLSVSIHEYHFITNPVLSEFFEQNFLMIRN